MIHLHSSPTREAPAPRPASDPAAANRVRALLRWLAQLPLASLRRHARRRRNEAELLQLDEHMLRDIGLTHAQVLARTGVVGVGFGDIGNTTFTAMTPRPLSRRR